MKSKTQYYEDVKFLQIDLKINTNSIKIPVSLLVDTDKLILKFKWKCKWLIAKTILKNHV